MARISIRAKPMLATLVAEPFAAPGWIFEEKYDGDRILAYKEGKRVRLLSRYCKNRTDRFAAIAAAIAQLRDDTLVLDGEVVVFDKSGISRFQALQQGAGKPVFALFDCLYRNGKDLRRQPLKLRRQALRQAVRGGGVLRLAHKLADDGQDAYRQARRAGYEGLIGKDLSSPYLGRRSGFWRKVKIHQEDEFIILGYTPPAGKRSHFGALLLGAYDRGKLRYAGRVGTGFDAKTLTSLYRKFQPLRTDASALAEPPRGRNNIYLKPKLVAQISYQELTADGLLRQPVFLGLRTDKSAREVILPRPARR
jgi:bifunctional non-homologous end joining protein LigD